MKNKRYGADEQTIFLYQCHKKINEYFNSAIEECNKYNKTNKIKPLKLPKNWGKINGVKF